MNHLVERIDSLSIKNYETNSYIPRDKVTDTKYETCANLGGPYKVVIADGIIYIYPHDYDEPESDSELILKITDYMGYWRGYDATCYNFDIQGNSILIKITDNKYTYVGIEVYTFETTEPIADYISPVYRSYVIQPLAFSDNYLYYIGDHMVCESDGYILPLSQRFRHKDDCCKCVCDGCWFTPMFCDPSIDDELKNLEIIKGYYTPLKNIGN